MKLGEKLRKEIEGWIWAIVVVIFIRSFIIQAYRVPTGSMENTLLPGDFLFGLKFVYGLQFPFTHKKFIGFLKPKRGQIIIFNFPLKPSEDYVKRCIGLPGDTVQIINKVVYINGKPLKEPYKFLKDSLDTFPSLLPSNPTPLMLKKYQEQWEHREFVNQVRVRDNFGPVVVPPNNYFVLGDNRDESFDSRFWGPVPYEYIKGVPFIIYLSLDPDIPWSRILKKIRWRRFFKIVLFN